MVTRSIRARYVAAALFAAPWMVGVPARADGAAHPSQQLVGQFDFDERPLGNFEELPMKWVRLTGVGLPAYSAGRLDDEVGHTGPPSLRFDIQGGSAACEYVGELPVKAGCDYRVEGYIRTDGLRNARAFIECALIDLLGDVIAGSVRVSELVGESTDWRRVALAIDADDPTVRRLRLRLWVLQRYAWERSEEADPIVRQDVQATAWFDDIAIMHVPRLRLAFAAPGGIVKVREPADLAIDVYNTTTDAVRVELEVSDERGRRVHSASFSVGATAADHFDHALPPLDCGWYVAHVRLAGGGETILERSAALVVVSDLPFGGGVSDNVGAVVPRWQPGADEALRAQIEALGVGAVKLGLTVVGDEGHASSVEHAGELRQLVRGLGERNVDVVASLPAGSDADADLWRTAAAELVMRCAAFLSTWQVGDERAAGERLAPGDAASFIHGQLARLVASARLVTPGALLDEPVAGALVGELPRRGSSHPDLRLLAAYAYRLSPAIPTAGIAWQLSGWFDPPPADRSPPARWLTVEWDREPAGLDERRVELARRILLAGMFAPARLFVVAPFEFSEAGGMPAWRPSDEFVPVRTLLRFIADAEPAAALNLPQDTMGLVFRRGAGEVLAIWTWRDAGPDFSLSLSLGPAARAWTLYGDRVELESDGCRTRVPVRAEPLLITDIDSGLMRLEQSVTLQPAIIQPHTSQPRPTVTFTNHYAAPLAGVLAIQPPDGWSIEPASVPFELAPGETLSVPLTFRLRPREMSEDRVVELSMRLRLPREVTLTFGPTVRVDLLDARLRTECWWDGDDLIVRQTLRNLADVPVRFSAFVQAPEWPQLDGAFLGIPPGETGTQVYRLPQARAMAGRHIWAGIREIEGPRFLDQMVDIPR